MKKIKWSSSHGDRVTVCHTKAWAMTLQSNVNIARTQRSWRVACQAFPAFTDMIGVTGAQAVYEGRVNKWNKRKKLLTCTCILYEYMYCTLF